jgi:hypothetical protein
MEEDQRTMKTLACVKYLHQEVTKRCRLSLLTISALVIRVQMRGEEVGRWGVAGSQPMSTALHIT